MAKKVLVLGAGASMAYGYPSGGELRNEILVMSPLAAETVGIIASNEFEHFEQFKNAFRNSQMYSIDAFLGRRPEYAGIGKKCIAAVLLGRENAKSLFSERADKDHWYQYLFNQLAQQEWDELTFADISIVTFNYDRSLQHYLYIALQNAYGKSAKEASEKLKSLRIVHVYGALCDASPDTPDYFSYETTVTSEKVDAAAEGLVVIPEGRADAESLETARQWLLDANTVAFLGFGFDPTNVARLAEGSACVSSVQREHAIEVRGFYGTCLGLYELELQRRLRIFDGNSTYSTHSAGGFRVVNCTELLRSTQILG